MEHHLGLMVIFLDLFTESLLLRLWIFNFWKLFLTNIGYFKYLTLFNHYLIKFVLIYICPLFIFDSTARHSPDKFVFRNCIFITFIQFSNSHWSQNDLFFVDMSWGFWAEHSWVLAQHDLHGRFPDHQLYIGGDTRDHENGEDIELTKVKCPMTLS